LVELHGVEERPLSSYSKGMVQRLLFAATLVNDPELLILDEPMSGLDPVGRSVIASVIRELRLKGKAVFFSSHIIQDVERLSDRVAVIVDGEIKLLDYVSNLVGKFLKGYRITYKAKGESSIETVEVDREALWPFLERLKQGGAEVVAVEPLRLS
jgi:ABC-2 type transport system ATP-binding protein